MANEATIGGDGSLFIGEDKIIDLELLDSAGVPVDMTTWGSDVKFVVRVSDQSIDPPALEKTAAIIGAYNSVRASNTQRARVSLADEDTNLLTARRYRYSFKRMTGGSETVLVFGPFLPQVSTTR